MKKSLLSKVSVLALAGVMVLALSACGRNAGTTNQAEVGNGGTQATQATPTVAPEPPPVTQDTPEPATPEPPPTQRVGISMPTQALQRWNQDGANMRNAFIAAGYEVDLQYADNEVPIQISQIENMIAGGVDVLIIAAVDGDSLTEVLATAKDRNIPVIAYDRLIMGTDAVTYYATFDNYLVGRLQGEFLEQELNLANEPGPFYIEFFTGDPADNNINFFFPGAMGVLQPYLDDGTLVCLSGQTDILVVATPGWSTEEAQTRMENLIATNNYGPGRQELHAVMCSNDSTAQGVTNALVNAGFTSDNFPLITGQDCDIVSVKNMIAGTQAMSVFKDTRTLANNVVEMVTAIFAGTEPPINDRETYDNGTGIIPTNLSIPVMGTIHNYRELLIDSGYYTEDQIYN